MQVRLPGIGERSSSISYNFPATRLPGGWCGATPVAAHLHTPGSDTILLGGNCRRHRRGSAATGHSWRILPHPTLPRCCAPACSTRATRLPPRDTLFQQRPRCAEPARVMPGGRHWAARAHPICTATPADVYLPTAGAIVAGSWRHQALPSTAHPHLFCCCCYYLAVREGMDVAERFADNVWFFDILHAGRVIDAPTACLPNAGAAVAVACFKLFTLRLLACLSGTVI